MKTNQTRLVIDPRSSALIRGRGLFSPKSRFLYLAPFLSSASLWQILLLRSRRSRYCSEAHRRRASERVERGVPAIHRDRRLLAREPGEERQVLHVVVK